LTGNPARWRMPIFRVIPVRGMEKRAGILPGSRPRAPCPIRRSAACLLGGLSFMVKWIERNHDQRDG